MSKQNTLYYSNGKAVELDFSATSISSDCGVVLLDKKEREAKVIKHFSSCFEAQPSNSKHSTHKILKQRVFGIMQGYDDCNDVSYLKNDPVFESVLENGFASQPTLSRFENKADKHTIFKLCYAWLDRYVNSLSGRNEIIIDIDGTDDPTHGQQELALFNGYYGHYMYNELFFHDGETGQIIMPVLRPGNSHSNKWFVPILKRIIRRIKEDYPDIKIIIRADGGFSCAPFYELADRHQLLYAIGLPSNARLKERVKRAEKATTLHFTKRTRRINISFRLNIRRKAGTKNRSVLLKLNGLVKV